MTLNVRPLAATCSTLSTALLAWLAVMFSENRSLALLTYRLPPDCVVSWRVSVCTALPAPPMDCAAVSVSAGVTKRPAPCVIEPLVTLTWAELVALLSSSVRLLLFDTHRLPRMFEDSESTLTNSGWLVA